MAESAQVGRLAARRAGGASESRLRAREPSPDIRSSCARRTGRGSCTSSDRVDRRASPAGEIVVVDQSDSPDEQLAAPSRREGCEVVYRLVPARGLSAARNEGIGIARHDVARRRRRRHARPETWFAESSSPRSSRETPPSSPGQVRRRRVRGTGRVGPVADDGRGAGGLRGADRQRPRSIRTTWRCPRRGGRGGSVRRAPRAGDDALSGERGGQRLRYRLLEAGYAITTSRGRCVYHRAWRSADDFSGCAGSTAAARAASTASTSGPARPPCALASDARQRQSVLADRSATCRRPRVAAGHATFLAGLLSAAVEWSITRADAGPSA